MIKLRTGATVLAVAAAASCGWGGEEAEAGADGPGLDLARYELVDLSHPYDENTVYWPTSPSRFRLDTLSYGTAPGGWFYSAFSLSTPEHGGTHLDAPLHFHERGEAADAIPLERLMGPAVVIDVTEEADADRDFLLRPRDIQAWEAEHGRIPDGSLVLLHTGWDRFWPGARQYLGSDVRGDADNLHFPGFAADAVRLLVEGRRAAALGIDAASLDHGPSRDFAAHRVAAAAGTPVLENLRWLDRLPATGATVIALPMKVAGGSGAPARVVALVPDD
jgi:kynurenine formamidase